MSTKWDKEIKNIGKDKVCKYGVVLFRETLKYVICCHKQLLYLQAWVPNGLTWAITWAMVENFETNCGALFLNKIRGYWLLYETLNATITISMELKVGFNHWIV